MAVTVLKYISEAKTGKKSQHLSNSINYIMNPEKTEGGLWVGSNCGTTANEVYESMMITKREYNKEWGRQGYHYVISFPPGECDEETCFAIGKEFCETYFYDYDYVFAVHNDHDHMHCHIVSNSVARSDGYKYRYNNGDWEAQIQPIVDKLCVKHGLKALVYDKTAERKGTSYSEHEAEKKHFTWKQIIRADIDRAVYISNSMDEFFENMRKFGYTMHIGNSEKYGKYVSYKHSAMKEIDGKKSERARRDYKLGAGYTYSDIQKRVLLKDKQVVPAERIYITDKLHIYSETRKQSRFQVCAIMRFNHARQFHYYNMAPERYRAELYFNENVVEGFAVYDELADDYIRNEAGAYVIFDTAKEALEEARRLEGKVELTPSENEKAFDMSEVMSDKVQEAIDATFAMAFGYDYKEEWKDETGPEFDESIDSDDDYDTDETVDLEDNDDLDDDIKI